MSEFSYEHILKDIHKRVMVPLTDIMVPVKAFVDASDHILKVIFEMVDKNVSIIPVLQEDQVVGVIRSVDILDLIADEIFENEEE